MTRSALGATRSKKPDLAVLARFRKLKELYIEGHTKNIAVIGELTTLEDLTLRSVTTPDLSYVAPLLKLWSLDIKLGGIKSLEAIRGMEGLRYLEIWQVRGMDDIGVLSDLPGLESLFLQSLPHIRCLPELRAAAKLRRVILQNLRGMNEFSALEYAPALVEFGLIEGHWQDPEQLVPVLRNPSLKRAFAGFGSARKNARFVELLKEYARVELAEP